MKLYEIDEALTGCVDMETGEILDSKLWEQLKNERVSKLENIGCWIKNLASDCDQLKQEENSLKARREAIEAKIARLREFLMSALDGNKLESPRVRVSYMKSKAVVLDDEAKCADILMSKGYTECLNKPTIRKTDLKKRLEAGEKIDGCRIEERKNMVIK